MSSLARHVARLGLQLPLAPPPLPLPLPPLLLLLLPPAGAIDIVASRVRTVEEDQHKLKHFWRLGSASDYVEYVVWLLGVIGVLYFLANPNARRNWHVDERDEAWNDDAGGEGDGEEGLAEAWQPDSAGDDAAARRESSSQATFRRRGGRAVDE